MTARMTIAATAAALLLASQAYATKLSGIATGGTVNSGTDQAVAVRNGTTDVLVNLAPSAATDTTNASNITGGKLATTVGGTGATSLGTTLTNAGNVLNTTQPINPQSGTSYTIASTDSGNLVTFSNASAVAVTLPQATTAGFTAGFSFNAQNLGAGAVTITPTTSTINGLASLTLYQNWGCQITSDGTNYQVSSCTTPLVNLTRSRVVTASGAVTVTTADFIVVVNKTAPAATTVNLPSSPPLNMQVVIKDGAANANTFNITVAPASGNICGTSISPTYVMNQNGQSVTLVYDGTQWDAI